MRGSDKKPVGAADTDRIHKILYGGGESPNGEPDLAVFSPSDASPGIDTPAGRTEAANAKRFVELHGENTRYCDPMSKWFHFDGKRWAIDGERIATKCLCDVGMFWRETVVRPRGGRELGPLECRLPITTQDAAACRRNMWCC
jgi:hypothetical protein